MLVIFLVMALIGGLTLSLPHLKRVQEVTGVQQPAPDFKAQAYDNGEFREISLSEFKGQKVVLFFYPLDFTFVCPTEIIAHDKRIDEFKKRGVEVVCVSIDSQFSHFSWRNTPVEKGGIGSIGYPMVADVKHEITQAYGIEHPAGIALRASFLIDKDGVVRHQVVNDLPLGRNVDEMLRIVDALQFHEQHGEVCPAGWQKGEDGMKPTSDGVADYLSSHSEKL